MGHSVIAYFGRLHLDTTSADPEPQEWNLCDVERLLELFSPGAPGDSTWCICSCSNLDKISMSSRYTKTKTLSTSVAYRCQACQCSAGKEKCWSKKIMGTLDKEGLAGTWGPWITLWKWQLWFGSWIWDGEESVWRWSQMNSKGMESLEMITDDCDDSKSTIHFDFWFLNHNSIWFLVWTFFLLDYHILIFKAEQIIGFKPWQLSSTFFLYSSLKI